MSTPKSKYPIESFGPELMEVLLKAGKGETVTLEFPARKDARRFQMRLHQLRGRMRALDHPDWKIVCRARTSLKWVGGADEPATLTISPYDSEFGDVLKKAGISKPVLPSDPLKEV